MDDIKLPPIEVYTDGSCLGNPGPGGLGYIVKYWSKESNDEVPSLKKFEGAAGYRYTTNNRMEIMASIYALETLLAKVVNKEIPLTSKIDLTTDSKYFCDCVMNRWIDKWQQNNWMTSGFRGSTPAPVKNKDLWEKIIDIQFRIKSLGMVLDIHHVFSHKGHEENERCDELAVAQSHNSTNHIIDEVYEKQNKKGY